MLLRNFLDDFLMVPVAPTTTGITFVFYIPNVLNFYVKVCTIDSLPPYYYYYYYCDGGGGGEEEEEEEEVEEEEEEEEEEERRVRDMHILQRE